MRVKYLDVSNNELTGLRDNQLTYLESIEYLNLSNNFIDTIQPFTFTDLRTLRTIDLSHNHLDSDTFVQKIDELQLLDLTANRYRSIDIAAFARIKEVKLIGNLWSCSWLVTELVNSTAIVRDDVHFGTKLTSIDGNAIVGIRQPEEVICYDIGNAAQESNYLFPRHIVVVYPKGECGRTDGKVWIDLGMWFMRVYVPHSLLCSRNHMGKMAVHNHSANCSAMNLISKHVSFGR